MPTDKNTGKTMLLFKLFFDALMGIMEGEEIRKEFWLWLMHI
jgi:hypothetical protein